MWQQPTSSCWARVTGRLTEREIRAFAEGLDLHEFTAQPALLEIEKAGEDDSLARVTVSEGKFHQVKRMFEAVGKKVVYLKRLSMGSLSLDETLAPGEYRLLTEQEIEQLRRG